ncbi:MAG: hypothetical protein HDR01_16310 [Lachnospiraceae bacterium]|nr:hypothetical protein [Lachnospiraceae bacterium]
MYNGVYDVEQFAYVHDTLQKWLQHKVQHRSLGQLLLEKEAMDIAIYGINGIGKLVYDDIKNTDVKVHFFIDKRYEEYRGGYDGIPVIGIEQLCLIAENTYILVTPEFYFREITDDLMKGGIPLERFISLSMVV